MLSVVSSLLLSRMEGAVYIEKWKLCFDALRCARRLPSSTVLSPVADIRERLARAACRRTRSGMREFACHDLLPGGRYRSRRPRFRGVVQALPSPRYAPGHGRGPSLAQRRSQDAALRRSSRRRIALELASARVEACQLAAERQEIGIRRAAPFRKAVA